MVTNQLLNYGGGSRNFSKADEPEDQWAQREPSLTGGSRDLFPGKFWNFFMQIKHNILIYLRCRCTFRKFNKVLGVSGLVVRVSNS